MTLKQTECITCRVRGCSVLDSCEAETLTAISTYKISKKIKKGERLFSEGDPVTGICLIKKGFIKVELNGKQGRPLILRIAGRGSIFGHRLFEGHTHNTFSATAASEVQYCYIAYDLFHDITCKSPLLQQHLISKVLDELEGIEKKAIYLAHKSVREKVAETLLSLARTYEYGQKEQGFRISLCRQDIADLAGTTKEQVSKTLKDFEKEGLLKCSAKEFSHLNIKKLQLVASLSS